MADNFRAAPALGHPRTGGRPDPRPARADRADRALRLSRPGRRAGLRTRRRRQPDSRPRRRQEPGRGHPGPPLAFDPALGASGSGGKEEEKKKRELEERQKKNALAGSGTLKETPQEGAADAASQVPSKEITKGVRWVAITGVLDNGRLHENYLAALKRPEVAYPHFKQLDVERQVKQPDGSWSDWEAIDLDRNRLLLDNLPEADEEWTPETVRISSLVAPLPFLKAGSWERVHVARMVPAEKLKVAAAADAGELGPGIGGENMPGMPAENMMAREAMPGAAGMAAEMMGMEGGGMSGGAETIDFEHTDAKEIMIRSLDFTVDPDTTYRFRLRIVVYNPNLNREDVTPGVDIKSVELTGPWSDPTDEVTMPPDVATYALGKEPPVRQKLDLVKFNVARWTPDTGVTVVKDFTVSPGELIGDGPEHGHSHSRRQWPENGP